MHAELAREAGIADDRRLVVEDGRAVDLTDDSMRAGEEISAGFVFVDGVGIGDVERVVLRDRRHLAGDGILVITVAVDRENGAVLSGPELISRGFIEKDTSEDLMREAREEVLATVRKFQGGRPESEILREAVRDAASRLLHKRTRRRPMVIPVLGGLLIADEVIDLFLPILFYRVRLRRLRSGGAADAGTVPPDNDGRS